MKRKVLIVEDKKVHREALRAILNELNQELDILCVPNEKEAYKIAMEYLIHLFLVDIILNADVPGDVAGLRFVQEIRNVKKYKTVPVIFISSLEDPKLYSYSQLHCFGYIEKPFEPESIRKVVLDALELVAEPDNKRCVYFRREGILYSKQICDIVYIENCRRKIVVHCEGDDLEVPYKTCDDIMNELASEAFLRCSRYTIINRNYIEQVDFTNRFIKLRGVDKLIEIGVTMKNKFRNELCNGSDTY